MPRPCVLIGLLALALVQAAPPPLVDEMEVPVARQVPLLTRVLAFDRNLAGSGPLVVAIVYQDANRASRQAADGIAEGFGTRTTVHGRPVRVARIRLASAAGLGPALRSAGAEVAYVAPLRGVDVGAVAEAASAAGVVTLTGVRQYVDRGVAVGLGLRDGRPEILLHRGAAAAAGARLSARLLQLATSVDR